jgi:uncharacterized damage-inducible protein DinB
MNEILLEAFRHSAWAMKRLIAACEAVSAEELMRPALGLGSLLATLSHLVVADARFVATLDGGRPAWLEEAETNDLRELLALAEESGERWQRFLRQPVEGERLVYLDKGAYETHAAVVVVQALHHVSIHGEQVCACLTALGVAPPDVQPWALADETGRSRWLWPQA